MADLSDVTRALAILVSDALYPTPPTGEAVSPVAGFPVRVEMGWPLPQALDAAVKAKKPHVSVYPRPQERNTTRAPRTWETAELKPKTYTLGVAGTAVTVGGSPPAAYHPQNLAVLIDGVGYVAQAADGSTPAALATALHAAIAVNHPAATVAGAVITLPDEARIAAARVGSVATAIRPLRQQERIFQITVWAHSAEARDAVAEPIDLALGELVRFDLPDTSVAAINYRGSPFSDFEQKQGIFRRDLLYAVEYALTQTETQTEIVVFTENLRDAEGSLITTTDL